MANINKGGEKRKSLSERQKKILQILVKMAPNPVTVSVISERLSVSSRTILRDVAVLEKWMDENDFRFSSKPGVGLAIHEDAEQLQFIGELLEAEDGAPMCGRQERRRQILGDLFFADGPVKAYVFAAGYHISERTLYEDLDVLDGWLAAYEIELVRRPGMGIFLRGSEVSLRQAIFNSVFEFYDLDRILGILSEYPAKEKRAEPQTRNDMPVFLDTDTAMEARRLLDESEKRLQVRYTDSGAMDLIIRIALVIYRMRQGQTITQPLEDWEHWVSLPEFAVAEYMEEEICRRYSLKPSAYERGYIAAHLSLARIWFRASGSADPLETMNVRQIVMSMTGVAERLTGIPFKSCGTMVEDLVNHVSTMLKRIPMNMIVENSQTEEVRQSYPEIYSAVETACQVLKEWVAPHEVQAADVGLIAMHFAAAAERLQENAQKIAVVVVCPTGVGSSRMLAASLAKAFHNIEIRDVISAFSIDKEKLRRQGIDLIISTIELHTDFPWLCVGKVLRVQDKMMLQREMETINRNRLQQKTRRPDQVAVKDRADICRISGIGAEIVEILQNFKIVDVRSVQNRRELIEQASLVFAPDQAVAKRIARGFRQREELGDTFIEGMNICLFHCKTDVVSHSRFGYLRLLSPLQAGAFTIEGAVIMLAPEGEQYLEPVSRLSALLIEEERFFQALRGGDTSGGTALAEQALVKYFQHAISKRRGGIE